MNNPIGIFIDNTFKLVGHDGNKTKLFIKYLIYDNVGYHHQQLCKTINPSDVIIIGTKQKVDALASLTNSWCASTGPQIIDTLLKVIKENEPQFFFLNITKKIRIITLIEMILYILHNTSHKTIIIAYIVKRKYVHYIQKIITNNKFDIIKKTANISINDVGYSCLTISINNL
jgi:hypothetical protein